jgi:hypothetical protein
LLPAAGVAVRDPVAGVAVRDGVGIEGDEVRGGNALAGVAVRDGAGIEGDDGLLAASITTFAPTAPRSRT